MITVSTNGCLKPEENVLAGDGEPCQQSTTNSQKSFLLGEPTVPLNPPLINSFSLKEGYMSQSMPIIPIFNKKT